MVSFRHFTSPLWGTTEVESTQLSEGITLGGQGTEGR